MPRCECCKRPKHSSDLAPMPSAINVLACSTCRETAPHLKRGKGRKPTARKPRKVEGRMDKSIFSFNVFEEKKGKEKDYRFEVNVIHSGVTFKFSKSMDEVRDFFTRQRAKRTKKLEATQG